MDLTWALCAAGMLSDYCKVDVTLYSFQMAFELLIAGYSDSRIQRVVCDV